MFAGISTASEAAMTYAIDSIPEGYQLQAYDDCGDWERQPHIRAKGVHEYNASEVAADQKARTVAWHEREIQAVYEHLNPALDYVVAVTYANEPFNKRTQSLWAGEVELHGPHALPKGKAERLLFKIPRTATQDGALTLRFRLEGEVNAVVSVVELWAAAPSPKELHLSEVSWLYSDVEGRVLNLTYEPAAGVEVVLRKAGDAAALATAQTSADGAFRFDRALLTKLPPKTDMEIAARLDAQEVRKTIAAADLAFEPVRYRPIPTAVGGLDSAVIPLDGTWRIHTAPTDDIREAALDGAGWGEVHVPGQWLQQGYDVPQDKPVAMAKAFSIPKEWAGYRIVLRFDAIHAGTRYWINGKELGYSENLFTPVEWDVTDAARPGDINRLDLNMLVDTPSERLSYSCGYAFHNLGGIDRSVRIYALPPVHVRDMRCTADLDKEHRDGEVCVKVTLVNAAKEAQAEVRLEAQLFAPNETIATPLFKEALGTIESGSRTFTAAARVQDPLKWSAEKPALYRLVLELKRGETRLERIERNIGFRKIEVRDAQLYVNGRRIKVTGACHHELDPLTGRADTMRYAEQDVRLMKEANLNYIRTSHYPPAQELLDAADRIGMYVEVEAPFCWVAPDSSMAHVREVLTPTSAMIDYCHTHPSVMVWSLANESQFNRFFEISNRLCKDLDPTRPTTFNNPDPKRVCDIANVHYPPMPYDEQLKDDPRPLLLGEYFFPICHEQTDVRIDPGLRELWGHGHSDPDSAWGKQCAACFDASMTHPGSPPGAWSHIVHSNRVIGAAIWAALDEPFYLPDGRKAGYAWHHGFWGLIDAWRRPKPEWWLSKQIFSPVWFPKPRVDFQAGQRAVRVPVENRYSFTDLNELEFVWEAAGAKGTLHIDVSPGASGELEIPIAEAAREGDTILLRVFDHNQAVVTARAIQLGKAADVPRPQPKAGPPKWTDKEGTIFVEAAHFAFVFDRASGDFRVVDPRHTAPVLAFPSLHVTRFDFGDLAGPNAPPYAVFPDAKSRVVEKVTVTERPEGLEIAVQDRYDAFAGSIRWLIDRDGMSRVSYDYVHTGDAINAREVGLRLLLKSDCDELRWRRWSEWGVYPEDNISRTEGTAKARRDPKYGDDPESMRPTWPWTLDQNELGTNDFRGIKFNIYEASLAAPDGRGVRTHANADAHVRACLDEQGVRLHVLSECRLSPVVIKDGAHIVGECALELLAH